MSGNNANDYNYGSGNTDGYGQEHKSTFGKVGDKIKNVFGKDSGNNESYGSSGSNSDSYGSANKGSNAYGSSERSGDAYGSGENAQESYGSNRQKDDLGDTNQYSGTTHGTSMEHPNTSSCAQGTEDAAHRKNETGFEPSDSGFGLYGNEGDTFGSTGDDPSDSRKGVERYGTASEGFESSGRQGDHDYETPRKGFGTTGGGGDSYGSGYVEAD